jgi:hypothetical protein
MPATPLLVMPPSACKGQSILAGVACQAMEAGPSGIQSLWQRSLKIGPAAAPPAHRQTISHRCSRPLMTVSVRPPPVHRFAARVANSWPANPAPRRLGPIAGLGVWRLWARTEGAWAAVEPVDVQEPTTMYRAALLGVVCLLFVELWLRGLNPGKHTRLAKLHCCVGSRVWGAALCCCCAGGGRRHGTAQLPFQRPPSGPIALLQALMLQAPLLMHPTPGQTDLGMGVGFLAGFWLPRQRVWRRCCWSTRGGSAPRRSSPSSRSPSRPRSRSRAAAH